MSNWISVGDELPNHGETVRSRDSKGRVYRAQAFNWGNGVEFKIVGYVWSHSGVTHWTRDDGEVTGYGN